jgi:hypothetical protein
MSRISPGSRARSAARRVVATASACVAACMGAIVLAPACSSETTSPADAFSCPSDLPGACPATPPSYVRDVAPMLSRRCLKCHDPSGTAGTIPLDTYVHVFQSRITVLTRVYGCQMPPAGEPVLTASERQTLLGWLVCEAPNN